MPTLDDLPPYRRARLLWEFAHFGVYGVEQMMQQEAARPCWMSDGGRIRPLAALGDDGLYHLTDGARMLCTPHYAEGGEPALSGGAVAPADVPREQQCRLYGKNYALHHWPPPPARTAPVRRLRAALVEALGADCHLCGHYPGAMVDHDHESGLVRGLLCPLCNRSLEACPHVDNCPKAEYMNHPPAAHLGLKYLAHLEWKPKESVRRQKIELLGFDPFTDWPPPADAEWVSPGVQPWLGDQGEGIL